MASFQFTDEEYSKLSRMCGVNVIDLQRLDAQGLLDSTNTLRMVMQYDYTHLRKTTKAFPRMIIQALANKYGLTPKVIRNYLLMRKKPVYYCSQCHKEIPSSMRNRFGGLCYECAVSNIPL